MLVASASTPPMPKFPVKYETWINEQQFNNGTMKFDFHNFETSFTKQVCGFNPKTYYGSWYGYKISKYIVSHRDLLDSYIPFYFYFSNTSAFKKKKVLKNGLETLKLLYDGKAIKLNDLIKTSIFYMEKKSNYYSLISLGYISKEKFIEISNAKNLAVQFEIDGEMHKFDLQIPKIYEETFKINN